MRIRDWSSDVCSSDHRIGSGVGQGVGHLTPRLGMKGQQRLAGDDIVAEADMQAHARCRYVRSAGELCQTGNPAIVDVRDAATMARSEEHTSELQSLMRISYAVFCLKKKMNRNNKKQNNEVT